MTPKEANINPFNRKLSGSFLKDWVWYHITHQTKYSTISRGLKKVFNLCDEKIYVIERDVDEIQIVEVNT